MASPNSVKSKTTEYHHFVPQFIFRRYSNYVKHPPLTGLEKKQLDAKISKAKGKATAFILDLKTTPGKIEQRKTNRIFGEQDMYRDFEGKVDDKVDMFEIEKCFSSLEQRAAKIIDKIEHDHAQGHHSTQISRTDKDTLRRFLFIMLYRNRTIHGRFDTSIDDYKADDYKEMRNYMRVKGFSSPKAVWLANIRAFLNVRLGPDFERWSKELMDNAYPPDATWFRKHLLQTFLSFCTTKDDHDEFVLTENAYGIFEGPNGHQGWLDWHVFAPINPRFLIVMRQNILRPSTGLPDEYRKKHADIGEEFIKQLCKRYDNPAGARSCLEDLPVEGPRTSYPLPRQAAPAGRSREPLFRDADNFTFQFFALKTDHVQLINSIFLEEAVRT
jgi:Protein of unknown function (DUF4238)